MNCFGATNLLLPDFGQTDGKKWAVVACDQFTSQPAYWEEANAFVGGAPSTLRMILPECDLKNAASRVPAIHAAMADYQKNILREYKNSMILVERTQSDGTVRRGLIGAVDLEGYAYAKGSTTAVRATEGTVLERIPPRVAVRRGATLESSHVMLLIDDPGKTVIEPLLNQTEKMQLAYDFDLMAGGGHITGYFLNAAGQASVSAALDALTLPEARAARYGNADLPALVLAVGDGNHSLASAKAYYEEIKAQIGAEAAKSHPARYAMAEVVNLHDSALRFEPIYRVVFHVDTDDLLDALDDYAHSLDGNGAAQLVRYQTDIGEGEVYFRSPTQQLTVGTLQTFLDRYLVLHDGVTVDYIHGEDAVRELTKRENTVGFLFAGMEKDQLFRTVMLDGALPRKTFSMGHAQDKRYYLECRAIL